MILYNSYIKKIPVKIIFFYLPGEIDQQRITCIVMIFI